MSLTKNQLEQLFDGFHDPVLVLSGDKLFYRNPAAKETVPAVDGKNLPGQLLKFLDDFGGGRFSTSAFVGGRLFLLDHSPVDGMPVFTLKPVMQEHDTGFRNMMSSVSGLMNSNIGLMKTACDMMADTMPEEALARFDGYYASLQHSYYSAAHIAGNMTVLSEAPSRKPNSGFVEFDIIGLLDDVISAASQVGGETSAEIAFQHERKSFAVFADPERIQRLFLNLLSNSMKYTPADGKIVVSVSELNNKLLLRVSDNGCGISDEKLGSIWNRYEQPKDLSDPKAGAGFGLPVVRQIAIHHGGSVFLESRSGIGTTVTVNLDIAVNGRDSAFRSPAVSYDEDEAWPTDAEREIFLSELADAIGSRWYGIDCIN